MTAAAEKTADLLAALWAKGSTIDALPPELVPASPDAAVAVQAAFIRRQGSCGWKVGPHPGGTGWCGAPMRGRAALASPHAMSPEAAAGMRVEVEVALLLGADIAPDASADTVRAAIASAHIAYELFRSSFDDPSRQPFEALLADHLSNAGIVLGGGRALAEGDDLSTLSIACARDGIALGAADGGASLGAIIDAVTWLAGYAATLGPGLRRGDAILTGARIGPLPVAMSGHYRATCALGSVDLVVG